MVGDTWYRFISWYGLMDIMTNRLDEDKTQTCNINLLLLEVKLPYEPVCQSVGRSVAPLLRWSTYLSVIISSKGAKFHFLCSYRSTCLLMGKINNITNAESIIQTCTQRRIGRVTSLYFQEIMTTDRQTDRQTDWHEGLLGSQLPKIKLKRTEQLQLAITCGVKVNVSHLFLLALSMLSCFRL